MCYGMSLLLSAIMAVTSLYPFNPEPTPTDVSACDSIADNDPALDACFDCAWADSIGSAAWYEANCRPAIIHEDSPAWDCRTMGNLVCGVRIADSDISQRWNLTQYENGEPRHGWTRYRLINREARYNVRCDTMTGHALSAADTDLFLNSPIDGTCEAKLLG